MLETLTVLRGVLGDPVVAALDVAVTDGGEAAFAALAHEVFECPEGNLFDHVLTAALDDENAYVRAKLAGRTPSPELEAAVFSDLNLLEQACVKAETSYPETLPKLPVAFARPYAATYTDAMASLDTRGFGKYAHYSAFSLSDEGVIEPVAHPDATRLTDLVGYEREKAAIIANTEALLAGKPAANVLLTGDAGTGKSSTVKAVVNELSPRGLRILEVRKSQLHLIPSVLDELTENPLKFILFIDDLSFQKNDDDYAAMKAILEGSVSAKSGNVVVYATSNRRHLVKETFSERDGDDVHRNDTLAEITSLSERFGLRVTFSKPNQETFLGIVHGLIEQRGLDTGMTPEELDVAAARFAIRYGGRSARRARQFVDALESGAQL